MTEPLRLRAGRSVGRTLYQVNEDGTEKLIGMVDTLELAAQVVAAVNRVGQTWTVEELRAALDQFGEEVAESPRAEATREIMDYHPRRFLAWLAGEWDPRPGR